MIGYDPSSERKLKNTHHAVAGAVSGFLTRAICQPFDVLKIRFQLQWEPLSLHSPSPGMYTGVIQATKRIYRDEGFKALWKGHVPAQYLSVVYGSAQFYSFQLLTLLWHNWVTPVFPNAWANEHSPVTHFSCGCMSGAFATVVSFPIDVVRTRLVAQGEPKFYRGMTHAITSMYTTEGVRSFFRGLSPAVLQTAPLIGAQFGFYNFLIEVWGRCKWGSTNGGERRLWFPVVGTLGSGALAGIASKTLVYPLDLIKKRLQMRGFEESRKSFGKEVLAEERQAAIFKPNATFDHPGLQHALVLLLLWRWMTNKAATENNMTEDITRNNQLGTTLQMMAQKDTSKKMVPYNLHRKINLINTTQVT